MMTNQQIGSFIAVLRKEQGLTQEQLAEKLGVSNRSISRWENGKTLPDFSLMLELARALDISLSELLTGRRADTETRLEDFIRLTLDLAQREKDHQRKSLNLYFGCGFAFLLIVGLHSVFGILAFLPALSQSAALWVCMCLGAAFTLAGFYHNRKTHPVSKKELAVLSADESNLRMKTAAEMLQFSKKYQHCHLRQHTFAFEELAQQLHEDEYAVFAFIADSCTVDGKPGPWHISAAVTNKRFMLSGETMRGCMLPVFPVASYDRNALQKFTLQGRQLVLSFAGTVIKIDGDHFDFIAEKLNFFL